MALFTEDSIIINAPASKVWDALINPALTPKYMFGCEVVCNWNTGDLIEWKGAADGVVYVTGRLISFKPVEELAFTVFDPLATYPDVPENYLTATYALTPEDSSTHLKVTQGDYQIVADGEKRYQDTMDQGGWSGVLESLKEVVESK
jgi:uncharacterized protein YndB with AHSA1/START domain